MIIYAKNYISYIRRLKTNSACEAVWVVVCRGFGGEALRFLLMLPAPTQSRSNLSIRLLCAAHLSQPSARLHRLIAGLSTIVTLSQPATCMVSVFVAISIYYLVWSVIKIVLSSVVYPDPKGSEPFSRIPIRKMGSDPEPKGSE